MLNQYLLDDGENISENEKIRRRNGTPRSIILWITASLVIGIAWAFTVTSDSADIGVALYEYIFYTCWVLKFFPQFYLNFVRKTTIGLSIDTLYFSLLAYGFCLIYCFSSYYELVAFNQVTNKDPYVTPPQIALSMFSFICTLITILQTYYFNGYAKIRVSRKTNFLLSIFISLNFLYLILVASNYYSTAIAISLNEWVISLPYSFGVLFAIRYIPQSWRFYRAKMFQGLALSSIWIEFFGSVSAIVMIVLEGYSNGYFAVNGSSGNLSSLVQSMKANLGLAFVVAFTMFYDGILLSIALVYGLKTPLNRKDASQVELYEDERRFYEDSQFVHGEGQYNSSAPSALHHASGMPVNVQR